ncbi:hypothetical protein CSA37_07575 [Candidatus Fermentibacteria bacterium]|nr:MAG: hypothetical protein CSA37_07575 [Candidatus Fermentibacteria bacterium]
MMSQGRILFVINTLDIGGAQTVLVNSCNALAAVGVTPHIVPLKPERMFLASRLSSKVVIHDSLCYRTRKVFSASKKLKEIINEVNPDAVHTHLPISGYIAALAWSRNTILVATEHGRHPPGGIFQKLLERWTERRLNHRIFVSRNLQELFLASGITTEKNSSVIYNPVPPPMLNKSEARARIRKTLGISGNTIVFNFTGALRAVKNLPRLFRSFASFAGSRSQNCILLVVGDGSERTRSEALCSELGIEDRVKFAGNQNSVNDFFAASDIFVLTSRREAFPMALVEAMLCGVVPVCVAAGGIPELLEDGVNGFLLEPDDSSEDAAVFDRAVSSDLNVMSIKASENAAAVSSPENHAFKLKELYSALRGE